MLDAGDLFFALWMASDLLDYGASPRNTPANRHKGSFTREEMDRLINGALQSIQDPTLPAQLNPIKAEAANQYKRTIGAAAWNELVGDFTRVRDLVKDVTQGFTPGEIYALEESQSARALLRDYTMAVNHASTKKFGDPAVAKALKNALPELKSRIGGFVRTQVDHGTLDELLKHTIKDETLLAQTRNLISGSHEVRQVTQHATAGFSNWQNIKTTIGSAARFEHPMASFMFYSGALMGAHTAWQAWHPKKGEPNADKKAPTWFGVATEGLIGFAFLATGLVMASQRIQVK